MGRTRGKQPASIGIGKVHKTMDGNALVFRDATSSIDNLIARAQENPLALSLADVILEEPGHAIEGENWRPQLAPYKPWVHDAALDETDELDGTDGDLLIVGALGMGISDEERMALIGDALRGEAAGIGVAAGAERPLTPHELWTLGQTPRWIPPHERETSQNRETLESNRGTTDTCRETNFTACETSGMVRETSSEADEAPGDPYEVADADYFATMVPVQVRRDGDGFALSAVHLSALADHGLPSDRLIVVVPAFIDGVPVVRIASEAFARRFTSGASVRLLVVPDTVEVVGAQAFGSVCAEVVYLGAGVRVYDPAPLDLALPNPRLTARCYRVSPANERFVVVGDCLLERIGAASSPSVGVAAGSADGGGGNIGDCPINGAIGRRTAVSGGPVADDDGSVFRLLFAEAPYGERLALPDGVQIVGPALLAKGVTPPHVIDAPASLARVDGAVPPETVWRGDDPAALARVVARCGGRVTDFQAVEDAQCWYGFAASASASASAPAAVPVPAPASAPDGIEAAVAGSPPAPFAAASASSASREAHLVAGPPAPDSVSRQFSSAAHARMRGASDVSAREAAASAASAMVAPVSAADRLALPRTVDGAPLTIIAERALITAPATLAIPDTVRAVRDGNACKGTRKLMLPEGLLTIGAHCFCSRTLAGPVLIPASVASIGEGSFEYAVVRLAAADAVVHITSDQLMSCFLEAPDDGIPFDFARYDDQLLVGRGLPDHLGALLHRLAAPFRLAPAMRDRIVEALRERTAEACQYVAREGDIAMVRALADAGFLDDGDLFDRQIERLRASNRTDCVLFLMNWQHDRSEAARAAAPQRARDRFAL